MNAPNDDQALLGLLKRTAVEVNYSPEALISLGLATARWQAKVVLSSEPPFPVDVETEEITHQHLADWPDWVEDLVPAGSRWERLLWPDSSHTVRLVTKRALVLAGRHFESAPNE